MRADGPRWVANDLTVQRRIVGLAATAAATGAVAARTRAGALTTLTAVVAAAPAAGTNLVGRCTDVEKLHGSSSLDLSLLSDS